MRGEGLGREARNTCPLWEGFSSIGVCPGKRDDCPLLLYAGLLEYFLSIVFVTPGNWENHLGLPPCAPGQEIQEWRSEMAHPRSGYLWASGLGPSPNV